MFSAFCQTFQYSRRPIQMPNMWKMICRPRGAFDNDTRRDRREFQVYCWCLDGCERVFKTKNARTRHLENDHGITVPLAFIVIIRVANVDHSRQMVTFKPILGGSIKRYDSLKSSRIRLKVSIHRALRLKENTRTKRNQLLSTHYQRTMPDSEALVTLYFHDPVEINSNTMNLDR